ncbi:S1 family peptidase [Streptomyces yaizuensis]|uniref:Trypsin-like serine protease n=1 Tax=Streptomyces yaizuensis TaxID=2989713 RepID=A0ABQ5P7T8_9ACTN|nr:serine protease [Streptomyces sp. YSPA8]GLF98644.1 trypsin-like serine protease [Streptomyces sp. YSPA8]
MNRRVFACLAGVGAFGIALTTAPSASAIVGGTPVADGKWPFMAQIEQQLDDGSWEHRCGAALIDKRVVATAAHCLMPDLSKDRIRLVLGRTDANSPGGTVVNKDRFSAYRIPFSTQTNTDLALLVLDRSVKQKTAALPPLNTRPQPGQLLHVAGWGRTILEDPNSRPTRMREAMLPVTEFNTEGGMWSKEFICAGTEETRVAGRDSGGPLFSTTKSGKTVVHGLVTGETNTCTGLFTNLGDPTIWEPFRKPLASHGLAHVLPKAAKTVTEQPVG